MKRDDIQSYNNDMILLLSSSDEIEIEIIKGLLEVNNIEVLIDAKGVGPIVGEKEELISNYNIFVSPDNINKAKEIIEISRESYGKIHKDNYHQDESIRRNRIVVRVLLLLTSVFFGVISYYSVVKSERIMGTVLGGVSVFFLLVFVFSFDWHRKNCSSQP